MFIAHESIQIASSVGAQFVWRLYFAPTELGLVCDRPSYKHSAPPELKRIWLAVLPLYNLRIDHRARNAPSDGTGDVTTRVLYFSIYLRRASVSG